MTDYADSARIYHLVEDNYVADVEVEGLTLDEAFEKCHAIIERDFVLGEYGMEISQKPDPWL